MTPEIRDARHAGDYRVWLEFADGLRGEIDLAGELWGPMFEPLKDPSVFAQVRADTEHDTIVWPNGADFAPEFLYERLRNSAVVGADPRADG
jgi:hypothetical protein